MPSPPPSTPAPRGAWTDLLKALAQRESGNRPGAVNRYGYLGLYQMGEAALIDAGFYTRDGTSKNDWIGSWTATARRLRVTSKPTFLASRAAQTEAVTRFWQAQWRYIVHFDLDDWVGRTVGSIRLTASGLLGGAHLVGVGGLRRWLQSAAGGGSTDGNGVSARTYVALFNDYQTPFSARRDRSSMMASLLESRPLTGAATATPAAGEPATRALLATPT
ncbi:MAG TPA: hypothetical protein VEB64_06145 [Azospirillaceae bacterium]|nr:hypothetical protein [Azospirillaceae bacterium]